MLHRAFNRVIINLESYQLIWIDTNTNKIGEDTTVAIARLREIVDYTKLFTNFDECLCYINQTEETKTFLVCSNSLDEEFVSQMDYLKNKCTIYMYCADKEEQKKIKVILLHSFFYISLTAYK